MRFFTPATALLSAAAIAMASTGLVLDRSADDRRVGEFGALTEATTGDGPAGSATVTVETPTHGSTGSRERIIDPTPSAAASNEGEPAAGAEETRDATPAPPRDTGEPTTVIADDGLYIVDPDSGAARQVQENYITDAAWLDDGHIAFIRNAAMFIANADGSGERRVYTGVVDGGMNAVNLSPDRKWLAFVSGSDDRPVYVMRSDGTDVRKVWPDTLNSSIGWAPDSKRVAFVAGGQDVGLRIYDLVTDHVTELYGAFLDGPTWTPDGKHIVFFDGSIMKIDASTGEYQMLAHQQEFAPTPVVLDADGSHAYYHEGHGADWWSVGIDGGTPKNIGTGNFPFLWTRSNGRAAIIERTGEQDCDGRWVTRLVVADADLSARQTLALAGTYTTLYGARWAPNGEKLLVRSSLFKTPRKCPSA
jgi:hypothetical protein